MGIILKILYIEEALTAWLQLIVRMLATIA